MDGEPLPDSRWHLPVFLDPGEHSVTISAPGAQRSTVKFRVTDSPTEQLVSVPSLSEEVARPAAPPPRVAGPADPDRVRRTAGIVLAAVGGVGLALGVTFGILAVEKRDEIGAQCSGNLCTSDGAQLYRDAQSRATIATISTLVGVGAGAVGGFLFFTSRPARSSTRVGILPHAGGAELGLGGAF